MLVRDDGTKISVMTINHGVSVLLPVPIKDTRSKFVLDTGACVSLISTGFYYRIPPNQRPELKPADNALKLEVANDSVLSVDGLIKLEFKINKDLFS